jgi:hypothetical protein
MLSASLLERTPRRHSSLLPATGRGGSPGGPGSAVGSRGREDRLLAEAIASSSTSRPRPDSPAADAAIRRRSRTDGGRAPRGRLGTRHVAAGSRRRPGSDVQIEQPAVQGARAPPWIGRPDGLGRKARRALPEGDDLLERRPPVRHGAVGRRAAARSDLDDASGGQSAPRLVPRLHSDRRSRGRDSRVRCRSTACWKTRPANSR